LNQGLGTAIDETTPYTLAQLDTAISALTGFTATVTGDSTVPAAFLPITRDHDLSATGSDLSASTGAWTQLYSPVADPLLGSDTNKNAVNFENVSTTQIQNCVYFANGYNEILKYDGNSLYRAGLPSVASLTAAIGGAGAITGTNYLYRARYIQYDAAGNIVEGNVLGTSNLLNPVAQNITVTVANVQAATGFNTNAAIVNGNQVGVTTITVDAFHTMQVGDVAYFLDGASSQYVERSVTAVGGTTITISGAVVNVLDNAVISNNLRIGIYRSESGGATPTIFFLVAEIPNNSFASTQVYTDSTADAGLGALLVEPITDRSPPSRGKYISVFRNQLVISGNINFPNTVFYSDIENPEYFPDGVNEFDVDTTIGDSVTGISPNNEVFIVFKGSSIHVVSGSLADANFRVDQLTSDIGLAAHATIQDVRGRLVFLSDRGVYAMVGGQLPEHIGEKIEPTFDVSASLTDEEIFKLKRAVGFNDRNNERYILFLPAESTTNSLNHPNENSLIFAYDYHRQAWLKWDNINMAGGMSSVGMSTFFTERRYFSGTGTVKTYLYRVNDLNDAFDYQDNIVPIDFRYASVWEALGEPSVLKRFTRIRLFALDEIPNNEVNLTLQTEINYIRDAVNAEFQFELTGGGYGIVAYDSVTPYGDPQENASKHRLGQGRVRSLRVIFLNENAQENVNITGWELEIAAPFRPAFKQ